MESTCIWIPHNSLYILLPFFCFSITVHKWYQYFEWEEKFKSHRKLPSCWDSISLQQIQRDHMSRRVFVCWWTTEGSSWSEGNLNHIMWKGSFGLCEQYSDRQAWADSVDPDKMLHNAASDLGLHCLPLIQQLSDTSAGNRMDLNKL